MSSGLVALRSVGYGLESTRGTAVPATDLLALTGAAMEWITDKEEFEDEPRGTLARVGRAPEDVGYGATFELREHLYFDQLILMALLSGVKGGVTGSGAGTDKTWSFIPGLTADPVPDTYTLEFTEESPADAAELEAPFCFCTQWELKVGTEGLPELTCQMVGRKVQASTKTPALSVPTLQSAKALPFAHYFDNTWAAMTGGTPTQILQQIYDFTYRFGPFIRPEKYQDGRTDLDFSKYEFAQRVAEIEFDVVHDPASAAFVQTEQGKKASNALRFVRNEVAGPSINGANYEIKFEGAFYHAADSMQARGGDRDGLQSIHVHLKSAKDPTEGQDVEYTVVNTVSAFGT